MTRFQYSIMRQFLLIWFFYRPYAVWSLVITAVIGVFNPSIAPALITKLFLVVLLWYLVNETHAKRKLVFYKNFGISSLKLFGMLYLIDALVTISYLLLFINFT